MVNVKSFQNPGASIYGAKQIYAFNLPENWDLTIFDMLLKIHKRLCQCYGIVIFVYQLIHIENNFDKA